MNINRLFKDKKFLEKQIAFFCKINKIKKIRKNPELAQSHLEKAKHNMGFYKSNKNDSNYQDWLIVVLYYTVYHACLALSANKGYSSKNHEATILLLIKEYSLNKEETKLIEDLSINKKDAQMYTQLKKDRHDSSYSTETKFTNSLINKYEKEVIRFINKVELILENNK